MDGKPSVPVVLAYHEVMPQSAYSYCVTCPALGEHLRLVRGFGLSGADSPQARITFDDGEQTQYQYALPLLAEYGIAATFFVTPGLMGTAAKFLTWSQLQELQNAGHSIESHGWSHRFLTLCPSRQLALELLMSKNSLEDRLGREVAGIAAPGGRWDLRVATACAAASYRRLYVSEPWILVETSGLQVVGRFMVRRTTTVPELKRILAKDPSMLWRLRMRSRLKKRVADMIGDGVYHRLWCRLSGYTEFEEARRNTGA
ncbi:MAG TPA: polysaccharide deacetylase family protein [Candidatus Angelobacter sp.]